MTRTQAFLARLRAGETLVADGATGTMYQAAGVPCGRVPESCVLEQPARVRALHREYVRAGSEVLLTNTFGGTRFRLGADGLASRVTEVNRLAAELARDAAGEKAIVAGDMGPTGQLLFPLGPLTLDEATNAYAEQAAALVAGGVDVLLVETMSDLGEARAAIDGARRVADLPVFCTFSFDRRGRTMMGVRPRQVASEIAPLVTGIGANCGRDPGEFAGFLHEMRQSAPQAILWAKPNAGLPHVLEDLRVVYDAKPQYLAQIALELREAGAQVIGGCCGTTPEHVAAIAAALRST